MECPQQTDLQTGIKWVGASGLRGWGEWGMAANGYEVLFCFFFLNDENFLKLIAVEVAQETDYSYCFREGELDSWGIGVSIYILYCIHIFSIHCALIEFCITCVITYSQRNKKMFHFICRDTITETCPSWFPFPREQVINKTSESPVVSNILEQWLKVHAMDSKCLGSSPSITSSFSKLFNILKHPCSYLKNRDNNR